MFWNCRKSEGINIPKTFKIFVKIQKMDFDKKKNNFNFCFK